MDEFGRRRGFSSDDSKESRVEKDVESSEDSDASQEEKERSLFNKTLQGKLQEAWVQCEKPNCLKWRSISKTGARALGDEPWFCYMNKDLRYSSCDVPEEDTWEAEELAERYRLIYVRSTLPVGSLVWAKMPGFCWWPGIVVVDVDYETSVSVDSDGDPLSYHIEFLGPKRSHAWIPEHMVEIYGERVPFDPSAGRKEKMSGLERSIFKGVSVTEAIKEANSFHVLTLKERLSRSHFLLSSTPVAASSKSVRKEEKMKKKRRNRGLDDAVPSKITRPNVKERNSQCDRKKKKKDKLATSSKLLTKDVAKEKSYSDVEPESRSQMLITDEKSDECRNESVDHLSSEEKNRSEATPSMQRGLNSFVANGDAEDFHFSRVVPDVDDVERGAEESSAQKTDAQQMSNVRAGKPSFMVPSSGSSKALESKGNLGSKKGFCPPVKTKTPGSAGIESAGTMKHVKPKAAAIEKARCTSLAVDQCVENVDGRSCGEELNEAMLSGDEEASAFDELADEICSVGPEEEAEGGLQQLMSSQSASLVGRTKEEKYTIDVQMYKENHDRFEQDVRRFMSQNKQRIQKSPVWENRSIRLFELFLATHDRGGYDKVCQKKQWTEIYAELTGISMAKPNRKPKNYYKRYLLPYELHINGREYGHLFTKPEAGKEPKKTGKPLKSPGNEDKTSIKQSKKTKATKQQKNTNLQTEVGVDGEGESGELEKLMLDLKEYDTLCQSQVSACLQHDVTSDYPTTPKKLTSTPARRTNKSSFLFDMEEDDLLNDDDAHIVPLACTLSPVFSSDRDESGELQEMEALKHELISMQNHLDEMNCSQI